MIQGEGSESSGSGENRHPSYLVDSEMAGPIKLKLGGMVEGMWGNDLLKEFFQSNNVDQGQVSGPLVPLLGYGNDKETPS